MSVRHVYYIGRYRVQRMRLGWSVVFDKANTLVSRHAARDLAIAAAKRYAEGDCRRAELRAEQKKFLLDRLNAEQLIKERKK